MKYLLSVVSVVLASSASFASTEKFAVDTTASQVRWEGKKKLIDSKHFGTVNVGSGEIEVVKNQIKGGKFEIDLASLKDEDLTDAGYNKKLVGHLLSEDFFDVKKFPNSTFEIVSVKPLKGNKTANVEIAGKLTIKDVTKDVSFPAMVEVSKGALNGQGELTIDRTEFNLKYGSDKFFQNLGDKVIDDKISFKIKLVGKKA